MNITKRMLQFGAAAVAVAIGSNALATGLTVPWYESFEGHNNNAQSMYDEGESVTNLANWASTSVDDASIITNMTYAFAEPAEGITFPIKDHGLQSGTPDGISTAYHTKVLKLNTEGGTLSASLNTTTSGFTSQSIYVDTMVNMVISEDDPSLTGVTNKVAVFANATSNLVIRHGVDADPFFVTNSETTVTMDPSKWYRLTITLKAETDPVVTKFRVSVDGDVVLHDNADAEGWFLSGIEVGEDGYAGKLESVAFQGTGFIDDLVVTTEDPFAPAGVTYVYVIEEYVDGVGPNYITVATPAAGWNKAYTPADTWSKIGRDTGSAALFTVTNSTVYAPADEIALRGTNRVEVLTDVAKTAAELGGQYSELTEDQIAWLSGLGYPSSTAFDTDANSLAFEEAMGLDPYVNEDVTAEITEFIVGDPDSTITVNVQVDSVDYVESGLTVKIVIDSKENLADAWSLGIAELNVSSFDVNGEASITFATPAANFFRARIVEQ